jgi:hypothetical protein
MVEGLVSRCCPKSRFRWFESWSSLETARFSFLEVVRIDGLYRGIACFWLLQQELTIRRFSGVVSLIVRKWSN